MALPLIPLFWLATAGATGAAVAASRTQTASPSVIAPLADYFTGGAQARQNEENKAIVKGVAAGVALSAVGLFLYRKAAK